MSHLSKIGQRLKFTRNTPKPQKFRYFLVLDFEATCDQSKKISPAEIIEFPVIKLDSKTLTEDSVFHSYVQPVIHPDLTDFCTQLTGIVQNMVDNQPRLEEVLEHFDQFMVREKLNLPENSFAFVTCGDWDLKTMLPSQCRLLNRPVPAYFKQWINLKCVYADVMGQFPFSMMYMLSGLGMTHQGRHHSGIDDAKNISRILCELLQRGAVPEITSCISE